MRNVLMVINADQNRCFLSDLSVSHCAFVYRSNHMNNWNRVIFGKFIKQNQQIFWSHRVIVAFVAILPFNLWLQAKNNILEDQNYYSM